MTVAQRAAWIAIAALVVFLLRAQSQPAAGDDIAVVDKPATFQINISTVTGSLKETLQGGQTLLWHAKNNASERRFEVGNISIALLRSETGGDLKLTFSGTVTSFGYFADDVKLNVIVRSKGGASLHAWNFTLPVKCEDDNKSIAPLTTMVPPDIAANVFTNAGSIEVAELGKPTDPGVEVKRCNA